jgi:DNA-binding MarR family transcriptional regulator
MLGMLPSRLVVVVDELESKGLIERRSDPEDRRTHALHLTEAGAATLAAIHEIAREHEAALCAGLAPEEKEQLRRLLSRIAGELRLTAGIHPGFRTLGRGGPACPSSE